MKDNYQRFEEKFKPHLGETHRWQAFSFIAQELFNLNRPVEIVETGCMREIGNWKGDGQSTLLWDFIAELTNGYFAAVDSDSKAVSVAAEASTCFQTSIFCNDSIAFLKRHQPRSDIDLLYLDSMDYDGERNLSALHHVGELACVYRDLKPGCLIAVDDCHSAKAGKHIFVKAFFDSIGVEPLINSYITVWRKP